MDDLELLRGAFMAKQIDNFVRPSAISSFFTFNSRSIARTS